MIRILQGDARVVLATLPDASVQCCVTSPPYFGLRDYQTQQWLGGDPDCDHIAGTQGPTRRDVTPERLAQRAALYGTGQGAGSAVRPVQFRGVCGKCGAEGHDAQMGNEPSLAGYIAGMVGVFREVRRVLRDDGTLWLNIGNSYNAAGRIGHGTRLGAKQGTNRASALGINVTRSSDATLKEKDLLMVPARLAIALCDDGWFLRSDIIWAKRNCMPESVTDRPSSAHEHIFLLTKNARYFYDAEAIKEAGAIPAGTRAAKGTPARAEQANGRPPEYWEYTGTRNARNVWHMTTQPFPDAHFATFPPELPERCIKAGTSERGCCAACGAPWRRETGEPSPTGGRGSGNKERRIANGLDRCRTNSHLGSGVPWQPAIVPTVGWRPTCSCDAGDPVRCTVLDPFAGAFTTCMVADRLRCDSVGIELNPEYCDMARRRLVKDAGMFAEIESA